MLAKNFGLSLPANIVEALLKRARKKKLIRAENKILLLNREQAKEYSAAFRFNEKQEKIISDYDRLLAALIKFASDKYKLSWNNKFAEKVLFEYLEINGITIISSLTSGIPLRQIIKPGVRGDLFVAASFVLDAEANKLDEFGYFESIVQGNILASSIYLPDTGKTKKKLIKTKFYFDTTFLIFALGYAGEPRQAACTELLELLCESSAGLFCFEHTLQEIENGLAACASNLSPTTEGTPYGFAADYFLTQGCSESDVLLYKTKARGDLVKKLNVRIVEKPEFDEYSISERTLDEELQKTIRYRNENARFRDVDSISAIVRLRKNYETHHIEDCGAVFVTTNLALARSVRTIMVPAEKRNRVIPPCITDHRLTAHLWLKSPTKAPTLSRKRIIADCYAAVQPSDTFWERYVHQINELKKEGDLTEENYYLLRYDFGVRRHMMEITQGNENAIDEDVFTKGTVPELLEVAREEMRKKIVAEQQCQYEDSINELKDQVKELRDREKRVEEEKRKAEEQKKHALAHIRKISQKRARILRIVVGFFVVLTLSIGATLSIFGRNDLIWGIMPSLWLGIASTILLVMTVVNLVFGTTIIRIMDRFEQWILNRNSKGFS